MVAAGYPRVGKYAYHVLSGVQGISGKFLLVFGRSRARRRVGNERSFGIRPCDDGLREWIGKHRPQAQRSRPVLRSGSGSCQCVWKSAEDTAVAYPGGVSSVRWRTYRGGCLSVRDAPMLERKSKKMPPFKALNGGIFLQHQNPKPSSSTSSVPVSSNGRASWCTASPST